MGQQGRPEIIGPLQILSLVEDLRGLAEIAETQEGRLVLKELALRYVAGAAGLDAIEHAPLIAGEHWVESESRRSKCCQPSKPTRPEVGASA